MLCRQGYVYEVERWIADGEPLQLAPEGIKKFSSPKSALQIALETGQHSLALLLLRNGYRLELERYAPLDLALGKRRWDLFDLLLEWGADLMRVDPYVLLDTYNGDLFERFRAAGYDLTQRHEMGDILGHHTRAKPLFGFAKRHRAEDPKIQKELDMALGCQVRAGNERGIALCIWAGADPHTPVPDLDLGFWIDEEPEDEDDSIGSSAIVEAAERGDITILQKLRPDPARDNFDELFERAADGSVVRFLATIQPPRDLTSCLQHHFWRLDSRFSQSYGGTSAIDALLSLGIRWEESDREKIYRIRCCLMRADRYDLEKVIRTLKKPEACSSETYTELIRPPRIRVKLSELGLYKKPPTKAEERAEKEYRRAYELRRLKTRYDRDKLYEQVWSQAVQIVAKSYGISGRGLGKVCAKLRVPVPPRGYWARIRSGHKLRRPSLPRLEASGSKRIQD